jgi:hypothetical protein
MHGISIRATRSASSETPSAAPVESRFWNGTPSQEAPIQGIAEEASSAALAANSIAENVTLSRLEVGQSICQDDRTKPGSSGHAEAEEELEVDFAKLVSGESRISIISLGYSTKTPAQTLITLFSIAERLATVDSSRS